MSSRRHRPGRKEARKMPRRTRRQLVGGKLEDAEADERRQVLESLCAELRRNQWHREARCSHRRRKA
jgi:hypothetical protein